MSRRVYLLTDAICMEFVTPLVLLFLGDYLIGIFVTRAVRSAVMQYLFTYKFKQVL